MIVYVYLGAMVALMIYAIVVLSKDGKARKAYQDEVGRKVTNKEWNTYKKQLADEKKQIKEYAKQTQKKAKQSGKREPVKTKILDHSSGAMKGGGGGVGRAIIGGAIAGPVGAVVGAGTRKQKFTQDQYTMFKVWYGDGHTEVEKVSHKSPKYKKYLELLEE